MGADPLHCLTLGVGISRAGWVDTSLAVQSRDESVRATSIHVRTHRPSGDTDVDCESALLGFHGQDDTGKFTRLNVYQCFSSHPLDLGVGWSGGINSQEGAKACDFEQQVWEIASVQCVQTLEGHTNVVMDLLCWDSFLLSCSLDGTVKASVAIFLTLQSELPS